MAILGMQVSVKGFRRHRMRNETGPANSWSLRSWKIDSKQKASFSCACLALGIGLFATGCGPAGTIEGEVRKKPRPIEAMLLETRLPPLTAEVSASVASWKTEQIGFEVSGRVEWVIEPGTDVEGRIADADGTILIEGTPIARIDSERYRLQEQSARAEVARAEQSVEAVRIEIDKSLPAQMRAAEAESKLAETELVRSQRLVAQNAGAQADVDRDQANFENAQSRIEQLNATIKAKQAELESLRLQVEKANQALRDAERSLEDCVLYSSFRGQIADVEVVPGSVVSAGQPVATVQMMDPIKIELEVSAKDSRRLRKRQRLPVAVTQVDGTQAIKDGFLYLIDPTADPQTRTYTLTLLMLNERNVISNGEGENRLPVTDQTWRLDFSFLPGYDQGTLYAVEQAIHYDDDGPFLWRVTNMTNADNLPEDHVIEVSKLRIELGESHLPFLGNWVFQEVRILDSSFDPQLHLVAGKLTVPDGETDDWDGKRVKVDRDTQWKVRPGDLVRVDLSEGTTTPGIYVPMDAIVRTDGQSFVFLIEEDGADQKVVKCPVQVMEAEGALSSLLQVLPDDSAVQLEGRMIATRGVHYLRDGEVVKASLGEDLQ